MKRTTLAVVLFLFPLAGVAQDNTPKPDGTTWQTWTDSGSQGMFIKAAYVQGALEGLRAGAMLGYLRGRNDEADADLAYVQPCIKKGPCAGIPVQMLIRPINNSTVDEYTAGADKLRGRFAPQSASILDIVHQTDKFYADYRNTPVCMIQAVQESVNSLGGKASSGKELEMMRKQACAP